MDALTTQQQKIFDFIRQSIEATGFPPTRAEIVEAFEFRSPNAAESHLRTLERKGAIELLRGSARGIRVKGEEGLPLIDARGRRFAHPGGSPCPGALPRRSDSIQASRRLSAQGAWHEHGRDAGILDGDLVAVHSTPEARSGQIVVARVHDEVTVKRLLRRGAIVELLPENPDFEAIVVECAVTLSSSKAWRSG